MDLKIGERSYDVIIEKNLKATSSVRIKNGKVILKMSRYVRGRARDRMIEKFLNWAAKKLAKVEVSDFVLPDYKDGGRICTHNKVYDLRVKYEDGREKAKVSVSDGVIELFLPLGQEERVKELVEKNIIKDQTSYLEEVLDELNQLHFQEDYKMCRFKRVKSRFGSCSAKRVINIAYRLLFAPREVFRYVCVHELAHLKEFNHSKRFWNLVAGAMPEYKESEKWLRQNGFMLG